MKPISIVIPTFDEKSYVLDLLKSISQLDYPKELLEIIVVNDGSTDGTVKSVKKQYPKTVIINLHENIGRYQARKMGAESAKFNHILFLDSRTLVDKHILNTINQTNAKAIKGRVECGNPNNPFYIFFESIRHKIYPKFYKIYETPFEINNENFDSLPKGTGVFFVEKSLLMTAYKDLSSNKMGKISSDDTLLIRTINQYAPILYHPEVKITHFIRGTFLENFLHLIYRGSTFTFYYLDPSKRLFWIVLAFPSILFLTFITSIILFNPPWFFVLALMFSFVILIALYLAKGTKAFFTILLMIPVSIIAFYLGIIRGLIIQIFNLQST